MNEQPPRPTHCDQCQTALPPPPERSGAAGYAVTNDGRHICYDCAHAAELVQAHQTGRLFCYVRQHPDAALPSAVTLTTWPGNIITRRARLFTRWRSNMGDMRRSVRATLPDGSHWYGTYYESAGDYARLKRRTS